MKRFTRSVCLGLLLATTGFTALAESPQETTPNNSALDSEIFYRLIVGELSAQNGDNATAFALFLDAARKTNSSALYEKAVELALKARDGEAALKAAQDWARAMPTSPEAHRYLLQILLGLNRTAETLEPLKRILATLKAADRLRSIGLLPRLYARATDKKQAAMVAEQALAPDLVKISTGPTAWASVGLMRLAAGDGEGALNAARRGVALNAAAEEPLYLALSLPEQQAAAAQPLIRKYLANKPTPGVRMAYARKLLELRRYAESYEQVQQLTSESPSMADAWLLRGSLELQDNKLVQADASLKTYVALATELSPPSDTNAMGRGLVQAYLMLADIAEKDRRFDDANAYLQRINSPQDSLRIQTRRAMILARQGKLAEARALIRELPVTQATDARFKINAEVQLLREYKQYPAAYQLLTEAIAQNPQDVELVYEQATMAEKMGNMDEMEKLLRRVIAAKPDYHAAYNALGYSLADRKLRLPEARQLIKKALEFAPDDPYIVDSLAWVEFRSGNLTEALRLLQQAYKARPDAEIAAHMGEVLWVLGEYLQAHDIWNQGKALNPENETLLETIQRLSPKK